MEVKLAGALALKEVVGHKLFYQELLFLGPRWYVGGSSSGGGGGGCENGEVFLKNGGGVVSGTNWGA